MVSRLHWWLGQDRDPEGPEADAVGALALLHTPRTAAACPWVQPHCPGRRKGLRISPQGCGTLDTAAAAFGFPPGAVPATGFLKQSGINIDSKGFIVVNKVSPGAAPVEGRAGGAG